MEKPILFNTDMVKAILDGSKTQTRRLIKRKYENSVLEMKTDKYGTRLIEIMKDEEGVTYGRCEDGSTWRKIRPYIEPKPAYKAGDVLYVRETWKQATGGTAGPGLFDTILYKADEPQDTTGLMVEERWHPSIHMPKAAARIWLKVINVRCERLQDITYAEVEAEGTDMDAWYEYDEWQHSVGDELASDDISVTFETPYGFFGHRVWDNTMSNLEQYEKYGWDANPWVWVIEFERITKRQMLAYANKDAAKYADSGVLLPATYSDLYPDYQNTHYCPNCGAKMIGQAVKWNDI